MTGFISIPFKCESSHGFTEVEGIGKFSSAGIVLEFEAKILGLVKTGLKEARLPLSEILDIRFKKGFFKYGAKIEIRLKSLFKLNDLPYKDGKLTLKIRREDHQRAEETVTTLQRFLEESAQIPAPASISVNDLFEGETKKLEN